MSASEAFYLSPLRGSIIFCTCFLGLSPQANHLSPLRGSNRVPEVHPVLAQDVSDGAPEAR